MDPTGALYFADSTNNLVRKVYNGVIINVFNTPGPTGVALDSTGMLYIAAASYFGTVVQPIAGVASARDVTLDAAGDIYFTAGTFVMEIPVGGVVTTIAGSGASPYFGGDGGSATSALLYSPSGIVVDSTGNWYIADTSNNRIRMVTPAGVISTIAGTGDPAQLSAPRAIAIDSANNLYIADTGNNAVRKLAPGGTLTALDTQLNNPVSVAVDSQGSVYIADSGNNRIVQVTAAGTASTFAKINAPLAVAVAVDASGNLLVADASQIWKVASDGTPSSLITGLTSPGGMAFAPDGTLVIADTGANVIRQLSTSGVLAAIAGTGTAGFAGDGSPALAAQLNAPAGIAIGANGTILIADSLNNRIRSLTPSAVASETATVAVVNAASLAAGAIAPGEIITVFGAGFGTTNTQLLFDGAPATLFYSSATQINALAPRQPGCELNRDDEHRGKWRRGRRLIGTCGRGCARHFHRPRWRRPSRGQQSRRQPQLGVEPGGARFGGVALCHRTRFQREQCYADHRRIQRPVVLRRTRARLSWLDADQCANPQRLPAAGHPSGGAIGGGRGQPGRSNHRDPLRPPVNAY